ncbi:MAG TPA: class I SAM-dependent methyltransferase [Gemmataceae bacterium]|jgi:SAM-dependent methyltransferase
MTASRTLRRFASRAAGGLRRLTGRRAEVDYRRWYSTWDLQRDYWTIVGPATKEEYEQLGAVKLQLLLNLGLKPDDKVLDVGCGTGLLTAALHDYLSDRGLYCGTDISPDAIAFCRSRFWRHNFSFRVSAMTTLPPLVERFHFIVFYSVFTHTYPRETALLLHEANRLLADDGVIFADLFAAPLVDRYAGDRAAVEVNPDYLLQLLDGSGLRAELVQVHPAPQLGQRLFFKFTRQTS